MSIFSKLVAQVERARNEPEPEPVVVVVRIPRRRSLAVAIPGVEAVELDGSVLVPVFDSMNDEQAEASFITSTQEPTIRFCPPFEPPDGVDYVADDNNDNSAINHNIIDEPSSMAITFMAQQLMLGVQGVIAGPTPNAPPSPDNTGSRS